MSDFAVLGYILPEVTLCAACVGESAGIPVTTAEEPCRCTCDGCGEYLWGEIGRTLP